MATKRKPYVRQMNADWWKHNPFYKFYMLREGTALFSVWVSLLLLCGMAAPHHFINVLKNPVVMLVNVVALAAALFHTKTWFELAPKAVHLTEKQTCMAIKSLWGLTILASIIVLLIAFV